MKCICWCHVYWKTVKLALRLVFLKNCLFWKLFLIIKLWSVDPEYIRIVYLKSVSESTENLWNIWKYLLCWPDWWIQGFGTLAVWVQNPNKSTDAQPALSIELGQWPCPLWRTLVSLSSGCANSQAPPRIHSYLIYEKSYMYIWKSCFWILGSSLKISDMACRANTNNHAWNADFWY